MKNNQSRQKLFARILALVLAVLMVGGTLYSLIYMLVFSARAADVSLPTDDVRMRVGIMYDNGVTPSFETSTVAGFQLGIVALCHDAVALPLFHISICLVALIGGTGHFLSIQQNFLVACVLFE